MGARSSPLEGFGDEFAWSLLDAAPDAMLIVGASGEVAFANDRAAGVFGRPVDDLVGTPVEDLLPAELRSVHRAHRTRYRAEPTVRPMGAGIDLRAVRPDGTEFPVEISLSPVRLGNDSFVVATVRDISERVQAEDHLRRVVRTLDASSDGMFIFDAASLRFSFVNAGAVRLTGYDRDELLAMTPLHLDAYGNDAGYRQVIDALLADPAQPVVRQGSLLRRDGREVPVEHTYQAAPRDRDGTNWVIALSRDITERLAAEAQLTASQAALHEAEQVLAIAEDRERIARDLHDTVIQRLFAEGLNLQATMIGADERVQERLQTTIDGLDATIKELRMAIFSLSGPGAMPGGLRGRLLAVVNEAAGALGFEPRLQFDGPVETIPDAIAEHLVPVIREALSNVARHARAHTVRVAVAVGDEIRLTVTDDGVGVPEEVLGGRGLGNLSQRAAQLDGECTIRPRLGGGSVLEWRAPVDRVAHGQQ